MAATIDPVNGAEYGVDSLQKMAAIVLQEIVLSIPPVAVLELYNYALQFEPGFAVFLLTAVSFYLDKIPD